MLATTSIQSRNGFIATKVRHPSMFMFPNQNKLGKHIKFAELPNLQDENDNDEYGDNDMIGHEHEDNDDDEEGECDCDDDEAPSEVYFGKETQKHDLFEEDDEDTELRHEEGVAEEEDDGFDGGLVLRNDSAAAANKHNDNEPDDDSTYSESSYYEKEMNEQDVDYIVDTIKDETRDLGVELYEARTEMQQAIDKIAVQINRVEASIKDVAVACKSLKRKRKNVVEAPANEWNATPAVVLANEGVGQIVAKEVSEKDQVVESTEEIVIPMKRVKTGGSTVVGTVLWTTGSMVVGAVLGITAVGVFC
ncbi:hypothetical protein HDU79_007163 [Rhizoclosmatium sp. JEL0117]|nr:hypothetical protein HDU79_007163 [Rhizoclosmatium sp. JEL0117]